MRKEILIVVLVGIAIGVLVSFGIYTAQTAIKQQKTQAEPTNQNPTPTPEITSHNLVVLQPVNDAVSEEETIKIVGKTSPNSVVAIIAQDSEYLLTADDQGEFSVDVSLTGGANQITVSAFDEQGNKAELILTVVYSTAEL